MYERIHQHIGPENFILSNISSSLRYTNIGKSKFKKKILRIIVEEFPDSFDAWYNLGVVYFEEKKYEKALDALEKAIGRKPLSKNMKNIGHAYIRAKNMKVADIFVKNLKTLNFHYYDRALVICDGILEIDAENKKALQLKRQIIAYRDT